MPKIFVIAYAGKQNLDGWQKLGECQECLRHVFKLLTLLLNPCTYCHNIKLRRSYCSQISSLLYHIMLETFGWGLIVPNFDQNDDITLCLGWQHDCHLITLNFYCRQIKGESEIWTHHILATVMLGYHVDQSFTGGSVTAP